MAYSTFDRQDVVMLHCNPIMEGIVNPQTVTLEFQWWILEDRGRGVESENEKRIVFKENFRLSTKTFSTLDRQYWKIGERVSPLLVLPLQCFKPAFVHLS